MTELLSSAVLALLLGLAPANGDLQKLPPLECVDAKGKVVLPAAKIQRVGPGVSRPEMVQRVQPVWPQGVRVLGTTILEAVIDASGAVCAVRILKAPSKDIGELVAAALRASKFSPARIKDRAVPVYYVLTVTLDAQ